jgi:hypothetical protein
MSLIQSGKTFSDGEQLTAAKLNQILGDATVSTSGVDGSTLTVNENGALAVRTGGIGTTSLANSGVTADKIATDAVTSNKIANDAVTREKINDFAVDTDRLATDAVTNAKIADLAVGTAELQSNAVNLSKIADANLATAADNGTTIPDSDSKLPTAKLVKDYVEATSPPVKVASFTKASQGLIFNSTIISGYTESDPNGLASESSGTITVNGGAGTYLCYLKGDLVKVSGSGTAVLEFRVDSVDVRSGEKFVFFPKTISSGTFTLDIRVNVTQQAGSWRADDLEITVIKIS